MAEYNDAIVLAPVKSKGENPKENASPYKIFNIFRNSLSVGVYRDLNTFEAAAAGVFQPEHLLFERSKYKYATVLVNEPGRYSNIKTYKFLNNPISILRVDKTDQISILLGKLSKMDNTGAKVA